MSDSARQFRISQFGFAAALVKAVLATGRGTPKMQEIAAALQEGATAYLTRQFKTLGIFVVIAVVVLFLLPVSDAGSGRWWHACPAGLRHRIALLHRRRCLLGLHRRRRHGAGHPRQPARRGGGQRRRRT